MLYIKNVNTMTGKHADFAVPCEQNMTLQADELTVLPGVIDPHVHFRVPGLEYKEDWQTAAAAAIAGGYTTVFDMPNTKPPTVTKDLVIQKKQLIATTLQSINIPLRYYLYFGADKNHFSEVHRVKQEVIGVKIFMGESTGSLL